MTAVLRDLWWLWFALTVVLAVAFLGMAWVLGGYVLEHPDESEVGR